ncbi:hypothetical protein A8709_23995 [Paenibacillus pectinilyticus]|uniref:Uncharacterized protein n=1 Tax=Paenibacillus pectinilyticus TaxID=512399 RepID=A0A1C1A8X6_9BACL|nr:hypothetical protein [Paenibacillus pectinilyticus]OCT17055.1 hypothetical protein A8709_23995 [Paenibacillus pectinilyticus]
MYTQRKKEVSHSVNKNNVGLSNSLTSSPIGLIMNLQRTVGNRAVAQFVNHSMIQRQLSEEDKTNLKDDLTKFYNEKKKPKSLFMEDAKQIASKHGVDKDDLRNYYKNVFYKEMTTTNGTSSITAPVSNGVLSITALGRAPFSGASPTQRYLDTSYDYMGIYEKHISVAYTLVDRGSTARITSIHVSFKLNDHTGFRFYWNVHHGTIARDHDSFPAAQNRRDLNLGHTGALQIEAIQMITNRLNTLKCQGNP